MIGYEKRSQKLEWMDLGGSYYTPQQYRDCLYKLDRIGRWLGGDRASFSAISKLSRPPQSITDIGCGGGLFTIRLGQTFPQADVAGIDLSSEAIAFAKEQLCPANVSFAQQQNKEINNLSSDLLITTLVCHHMTDAELVTFLQQSYRAAKQSVIINDLHRHPLASCCFALVAPILFPNRMILHDGLLSIRRAFTRNDWAQYLAKADIPLEQCSIQWYWPFRWVVMIQKE